MKLWEQAAKYKEEAAKARNEDVAIELLDKAISLWLQSAEQDITEVQRATCIGNARNSEANGCTMIASKLVDAAIASSGSKQAGYLKEAADQMLTAVSSRTEAAEIVKEQGYQAPYYNRLGIAYTDQAFHHYYLAWASYAVGDTKSALSGYKEALSILKTALKHINKSLQIESNRDRRKSRKDCLDYMKLCRAGIREAKLKRRSVR
jgi:tetratricopeptide (TPR) repeat protein